MRPTSPAALAAAILLAILVSCARAPQVVGESIVLDENVALVRGKSLDTAMRELIVPADGTCVAIVEENDGDVVLELQTVKDGAAPSKAVASKVEVESLLDGEGVEVAAVPVNRGSKVALALSMPPDMPAPAHAQTRIVCYDSAAPTPETVARVAAYQAWSEAMPRSATVSEESIKRRRELLDVAIAKLESDGRDARMAAWAHLVKGNMLHESMLDLPAATSELRAAEKSFAVGKEARNVARARLQLASTLADRLNDATSTNPTPAEAKVEAEKISNELTAQPAPFSALERARAIETLGVVCFQLADYDCATRYFESAADAVRKIGHHPEEIILLHNLGVIALDLGNYASAVSYFDRFLPMVNKAYSPVDYSSHHYNAGVAYASFGDTSRGIKHLQIALEDARERQSAIDLGRVMAGLGVVYWRRGDAQQAETFFTESLKQQRIATDGITMIGTLGMTGRFARFQGRTDEALALHREALARASTPNTKARAKYELALDEAAAGRTDLAIALCRDALKESDKVAPIRRAYLQIQLAGYLVAGNPDARSLAEADALSQAALTMALKNSDMVIEVSARQVRAKLLAARKKLADARREYESAIAVILDFRGSTGSPELQASALAIEQETFRGYVDLLMRASAERGTGRFAPASPEDDAALRVLELARSGGKPATSEVNLNAATQSKIDALLQQMAAKRVRIAQINNSASPGGSLAESLQLEMSQLRVEVDRLRGSGTEDLRSDKLPGSLNRPWPRPMPGVTQLSYAMGERHTYLWARDAHGLRVAVLGTSPAELERKLAEFGKIDYVRSPAKLEEAIAALSGSLLPPGTLDATARSVEVVAEGALGTLPFAALHDPETGKRVVESHDVRMITSMFDKEAAKPDTPRAMAFLGIASTTGKLRSAGHEFSGLSAARAEARAIAGLFATGSQAAHIKLLNAADGDAETIKALWTGGADAVHFATHGLANLRYPSASLLLLPKGGTEKPAYLTAGQVQEWRGNVGLVFLAACETAAGPSRFAEGMSGLPRSFLTAGARGIVGTLWSVEDIYESEFAVDFYRRFIAGQDAESALAETQRVWLKPRPGEKSGEYQQRLATAWAHVFHARPKSR
jgi:CHAT domain-containing protein/tetratricopeptide (TPR) repeat protein